MNPRYQRPKGTIDILPEAGERRETLRRVFWELADRYGYRPIETPVFEQTSVFVETVGAATDIVRHERYTFVDEGGISLTLRPEATAAIARAYVENGLAAWPQPVRLAYWMPMFRRERPQAGRFRQHWQYGIELWGADHPAADAEVVIFATRFLEAVGRKSTVRVNSLGCAACRPRYREALVAYYRPHAAELCPDCQVRLEENPLRLLDCKRDVALKASAPDFADYWCPACRDHMTAVLELLRLEGVQAERDPRLVRGLDYYTRTVFEVDDPRLGAQSTLLGGGRYDGLNARFEAPPAPAVGFAGGVERLLLALGDAVRPFRRPHVYVAHVDAVPGALAVAEELRRSGIPTEMDVMARSLKAQMRDAARRARWVVLVAPADLARGRVRVRDLARGEETDIDRSLLADWFLEQLGPQGDWADGTFAPLADGKETER
jgi:histidyl-tRNA synthetase